MNLKIAALTVVLASTAANAQTVTQAEALTRLFSTTPIRPEWFAPEFLHQVALATIQEQFSSITAQYGQFLRMDTYQDRPLAIYERGSLIVTSAPLDDQGRFTSFGAVPGPDPSTLNQTPAEQQAITQALEKLLAVTPVDTSLFSAEFLQAVPEAKLNEMFGQYREQLGAFKDVQQTGSTWQLHFEKGSVPVISAKLDTQGKFSGLRLGETIPTFASLPEAQAAFTALPGEVSLYVIEGGQVPLVNLRGNRPFAVGSTFKLAILSELQAQVNAGKRQWTDEITLTDSMKSLPSGTLQDAPAGNKYTLQDLATRMIRDSDNTATDLLLQTVGREGVETRLGQHAMPSTREAFALKNPANLELLRAYRAAGLNTATRRAVLVQAAAAPLPSPTAFTQGHTLARDVEWFASTSHLCQLMQGVAALPATQQNPGLVSKTDYARVSYKGGSEPGVLNLTTQVTTKSGKTYCVSATWNRPEPLAENTFYTLYQGIMNLLR